MKTVSVEDVMSLKNIENIREVLKKADEYTQAGCDKRPRIMNEWKLGTAVRQGDILITRVPEAHAHGKVTKERQLAVGNTQGSQHVLVGKCELWVGTTLPSGFSDGTFLGQCFKVKKSATVTHPEHPHVEINVPGMYQVTHQTDLATKQRQLD